MKESLKDRFSAVRIAYIAVFTALAFAVTFLEFPIFPGPMTSNLKLDFANFFFMIEGFIFGPVEAVISIMAKELLCLTKTSTLGVGELANFLMSTAYVIVPSVCYRYKKGRKWVIALLAIACGVQIFVSFFINRFINYPIFGELFHFEEVFGLDGVGVFRKTWYFVILFNLIKSVLISVIVFVAYKPLSRFIKSTSERFRRKKGEPQR